MPSCPVFLINLDRAPDRLQRAARALAGQQLAFERVSAVDGRALEAAQVTALTAASTAAYFARLTPGELGCYLSHIRVLELMVARDLPVALILEDDVEVTGDLAAQLQAVLAEGDQLPDVVKLSGTRPVGEPLRTLRDGSRIIRSTSAPATTVAAVWTLAGARRFLAAAMPPRWPIDMALKHWWICGLDVCWAEPPSVRPAAGPSTIGRRGATGWRSSLRRHRYRLAFAVAREWRYLARHGVRAWLRSARTV